MQHEPQVKIGVNVFLVRDGKILLGKRIGKSGYGTWGLPGGHFEYGESLAEAAKRELKEETGMVAKELEFLHIINDPREKSHYVHINFLAKNCSGEPELTEPDYFEEWRWFSIEDLPEDVYTGHKGFVPAFLKKQIFIDALD